MSHVHLSASAHSPKSPKSRALAEASEVEAGIGSGRSPSDRIFGLLPDEISVPQTLKASQSPLSTSPIPSSGDAQFSASRAHSAGFGGSPCRGLASGLPGDSSEALERRDPRMKSPMGRWRSREEVAVSKASQALTRELKLCSVTETEPLALLGICPPSSCTPFSRSCSKAAFLVLQLEPFSPGPREQSPLASHQQGAAGTASNRRFPW